MSREETGKTDRRYSDICGAMNNRGEPCSLPAGWGTPGSQGGRCRFHGGCSTGPSDTTHLDGNDFAEDNPGGGPPKGNTNSRIHGGFGDWKKAYKRFDDDKKAYVHHLIDSMREVAREHTPDVDPRRRERLLWERATLSVLSYQVTADVWCTIDGSGPGRGLILEEEKEVDGQTITQARVNPAQDADQTIRARKRRIAEELRLLPGYQ